MQSTGLRPPACYHHPHPLSLRPPMALPPLPLSPWSSSPSSLCHPSTILLICKPSIPPLTATTNSPFLSTSKHHPLNKPQHFKLNSLQSDSFRPNKPPSYRHPSPEPPTTTNSPELRRTLFPGGYRRPEIKIPSIVLELNADEVLNDGSVLDVVDSAISNWVGIVVLGEGGGGKLYKAACLLKSVIKDRAYLMVSERVDIASAVSASGVVLSDQGLPAIVARSTIMDSRSESVVLPVVGRSTQSVDAAVSASNSEGADFLIFSADTLENSNSLIQSISTSVKIPIFVSMRHPLSFNKASVVLGWGASGLVMKLEDFKLLGGENLSNLMRGAPKIKTRSQDGLRSPSNPEVVDESAGFVKVDDREANFVEKEIKVLDEAVCVIKKAAPLMEEVSLLSDATSQLNEPFLLVIVGEFNSGKSSFINALLGGRFLREGVVPTTNEITFLRYSDSDSWEQRRCERHPDGQYNCYLPAEILKEMTIVDTPGTNVILQRQQRLTEEFVPRADLLLFVISADRPLTESEVAFLRYTQQWKKNVVFILNKSDLYRNALELQEAVNFVEKNICELLNSDHVTLYPVSSRLALEAKLLSSEVGRGHEELVMTETNITTRSFYEFEKFLYGFLDGSTIAGQERKLMKLQTPIRIAERLLSSCQTLMTQECHCAKQELALVEDLIGSVKEYALKMENDSVSWRRQMSSLVDATQGRILKLVESMLQLSNLDLATSLVFSRERSSLSPATLKIMNEIITPAISDAEKLLEEYTKWLQEKNVHEGRRYRESFVKKWSSLVDSDNTDFNRLHNEPGDQSIKTVLKLRTNDAPRLFEQEIREVFLGALGGLGAAGLSASLLTSVLPTTMEDLLALGLCSAGGLLAISNFPTRRQKTIEKVRGIADLLRTEIEEAMMKDLSTTVENMEGFVEEIGKPYRRAAKERVGQVLEIQGELTSAEKELRNLQIELQNFHLS